MDYSWQFGIGGPELKINSWRCNSDDHLYASSYKTAHISSLNIWFSDVSSYSSSLTVYYVGTDDKFQFVNKSTTLKKLEEITTSKFLICYFPLQYTLNFLEYILREALGVRIRLKKLYMKQHQWRLSIFLMAGDIRCLIINVAIKRPRCEYTSTIFSVLSFVTK